MPCDQQSIPPSQSSVLNNPDSNAELSGQQDQTRRATSDTTYGFASGHRDMTGVYVESDSYHHQVYYGTPNVSCTSDQDPMHDGTSTGNGVDSGESK
jgi:hypothetical protein